MLPTLIGRVFQATTKTEEERERKKNKCIPLTSTSLYF